MSLKKNLGLLGISMLVLRVTSVMASDRTLDGEALPACHKQLATKLISEAQDAYKKAQLEGENLSMWVRSHPVGISMPSMHRSITRCADLGVTALKIKKLNRVKKTAGQAITACTIWSNGSSEDFEACFCCRQAIEALRKLQQ